MSKVQTFIFFNLLLGFISAYFSITVFQIFFALAILGGILHLIPKLKETGINILTPKGKLFYIPLLGHLTTITLSSALFLKVKEQWRRLIEQDFYSLSYFLAFTFNKEQARKLLYSFALLSIVGGLALSVKIFYSYWQTHNPRLVEGFWGGLFILGNLLSLSLFSSLYFLLRPKQTILSRILWFFITSIFIIAIFLPDTRSIYLGLLIGLFVFYLGTFKVFKSYIYRLGSLVLILISILIGINFLIHSPRFKVYSKVIAKHGINLKTLDYASSGRIVIAKGAFDLVEKAIESKDYTKLLIGWGYGPQKQYKNLPYYLKNRINEYESFLLITEFINGGLLNVIFIIWFYIAAIILTLRVFKNLTTTEDIFLLSFISAIWVNLIYHLFTLFWVPINAVYFLILGFVELLSKRENLKE